MVPTTFGVWNGLCNWWNTTVDCNLCNLLAPAILIALSRKFLPLTAMTSSFLSLAMMLSSQFVRFGLARSSCTEVRTNRFPKKKHVGELFSEQENRKNNPNKILDLAIILLSFAAFAVSKYIFMCIYIYTYIDTVYIYDCISIPIHGTRLVSTELPAQGSPRNPSANP